MSRKKHSARVATAAQTEKLRLNPSVLVVTALTALVLTVYFGLALQNITSPFMHVSEDTNGMHGVAIQNIIRFGFLRTKFGNHPSWLSQYPDVQPPGFFYTHHPNGYLLPTLFFYRLFGVSEATTRLGPLFLTAIALGLFSVALAVFFHDALPAFLIALTLAILPGTIYYGKHLDMTPPGLAFVLITFSFFLLHSATGKSRYLALAALAVILGGLMSWHYYPFLFALYPVILFTAAGRRLPHRRYYLIGLPLVTFIPIATAFLHFFIQSGTGAIRDVFAAYGGRSGFQISLPWLTRLSWTGSLNATPLFLITAALGLILFFIELRREPRRMLLLPLLLYPFITILLFQQWSTHPFGVIILLPTLALLSGLLFTRVIKDFNAVGIAAIIVVFSFGFVLSLKNLDFFYNKFLILGPHDINLLRELKPQIKDDELCIGRNQFGLYFGGIDTWYLQRSVLESPDCLTKPLKGALVFNPSLGQFYQDEIHAFEQRGLRLIGCADFRCVMSR